MGKTNLNRNMIVLGIQVALIILFSVSIYFAYTVEKVILNPIPYALIIGVPIVIMDVVALLYVFKETDKDKDEELHIDNV